MMEQDREGISVTGTRVTIIMIVMVGMVLVMCLTVAVLSTMVHTQETGTFSIDGLVPIVVIGMAVLTTGRWFRRVSSRAQRERWMKEVKPGVLRWMLSLIAIWFVGIGMFSVLSVGEIRIDTTAQLVAIFGVSLILLSATSIGGWTGSLLRSGGEA